MCTILCVWSNVALPGARWITWRGLDNQQTLALIHPFCTRCTTFDVANCGMLLGGCGMAFIKLVVISVCFTVQKRDRCDNAALC
jgi:hypothetical protein